jgi:hypothetical protein
VVAGPENAPASVHPIGKDHELTVGHRAKLLEGNTRVVPLVVVEVDAWVVSEQPHLVIIIEIEPGLIKSEPEIADALKLVGDRRVIEIDERQIGEQYDFPLFAVTFGNVDLNPNPPREVPIAKSLEHGTKSESVRPFGLEPDFNPAVDYE